MSITSNLLHQASSPYLLQHKDNPVHWMEWNAESLALAKKHNKPLLISVGYAACHWCHVMAHESFEDAEVADLMNTNFVCIKIDREERPDIDQLYMDAAQLLTGRGGWPLHAFALPDGRPFYAATYFPKENWKKVLSNIAGAYQKSYAQLEDTAEKLTQGIQINEGFEFAPPAFEAFSKSDYTDLMASWRKFIDLENGGFKGAPKFPMPNSWQFILQYYYFTNDVAALEACLLHLDSMAKGGIYDHLAGGFARYSVDATWLVPHFEKMLYDNAQLVSLYAKAYQLVPKKQYALVIKETLAFMAEELTSEEGGFYASLDADTDGEEGKYYCWTYEEIKELIPSKDWGWFKEFYQLKPQGNWEDGKNILHTKQSTAEFAHHLNITEDAFIEQLQSLKKMLHTHRKKRTYPGLDDKILTGWNALMLKAYVDASIALQDISLLQIAEKNADFLYQNLWKDGFLYRNYKNGKTSIGGFLEDYALLIEALMALYQVNFTKSYLDWAQELLKVCLRDFYDAQTGLFYFTSSQGEQLIAKKIEMNDHVLPASNSSLAKSLFIAGHLLANEKYIEASQQMLMHVKQKMYKSGPYFANWSVLAGWLSHPYKEVAIVGDEAKEINFKLQKDYFANALFLGGTEENLSLLKGKRKPNQTLLYVCENKTCQRPCTSIQETKEALLS